MQCPPIIPAMRKILGAVLVAVLSMFAMTCGGGGESNSITDPSVCSPTLGGDYTWTVRPPCGLDFGGNSPGRYDATTCTLTVDIMTDEQRGRGISQVLRLNFATMTATVTQNASPCASTDQGRIIRDPNSWRVTLQRAPQGNCCAGPWAVNLIKGE